MELPQIKAFMAERFPGYTFSNANPDFDIQAEEEGDSQADEKARDIFCHTWIYLYTYRRLVLSEKPDEILKSLVLLTANERLAEVKRFQEWIYSLSDLDLMTISSSSATGRAHFVPTVAPKGRGS